MRTDYLLRQELKCVLAALTPPNQLVIEVMLRTGLRVSDVLRLRTSALEARMWITEGKTRKRRQIGLGEALKARLEAQAGEVWVFEGRKDPAKHRTRQAVWHDVKRAAKAFRIPANIGTHSVRKTYAVEMMERYGDIERVRRALNHDRMETTVIYALADHLVKKRGRGR